MRLEARLEIKIGIRGYFGVKRSPRNTHLSPPSKPVVPFRKNQSEKQYLRRYEAFVGIFSRSHDARHFLVETHGVSDDLTLLVACKEVRLICPVGLKRCFGVFVSSRNSLIINFGFHLSLDAPCNSSPGKRWMM